MLAQSINLCRATAIHAHAEHYRVQGMKMVKRFPSRRTGAVGSWGGLGIGERTALAICTTPPRSSHSRRWPVQYLDSLPSCSLGPSGPEVAKSSSRLSLSRLTCTALVSLRDDCFSGILLAGQLCFHPGSRQSREPSLTVGLLNCCVTQTQ